MTKQPWTTTKWPEDENHLVDSRRWLWQPNNKIERRALLLEREKGGGEDQTAKERESGQTVKTISLILSLSLSKSILLLDSAALIASIDSR